MRRSMGFAIAWVCGCGSDISPSDTNETESTSTATSVSSSGVGTMEPDESSTADASASPTVATVDPDTSTTDTPSTDTTATPPDVVVECTQCDTFAQDCPMGERCVPWSCDGTPGWNGTRCSPIADDPAGRDEPCTMQDSPWSGLDDCERGTMCWDVDTTTLEGTCVGLCVGSPGDPQCADDCAECLNPSKGVLALCIASCNPTSPDCGPDEGCYLAGEAYVCAPTSAPDAAPGDPCEGITDCAPGDTCVAGDFVPGCAAGDGCCTPFCTIGDPDGCTALPGTACAAVFLPGQGPACIPDSTGICVES